MSTRSKATSEDKKDPDYDPDKVPRNLWAHNAPGSSDFNAEGTVRGAEGGAIPKKKKNKSGDKAGEEERSQGVFGYVGQLWRGRRQSQSASDTESPTKKEERDIDSEDDPFLSPNEDVHMHTLFDTTVHEAELSLSQLNLVRDVEKILEEEEEEEDVKMDQPRPLNITREEWEAQQTMLQQQRLVVDALQKKLDDLQVPAPARPAGTVATQYGWNDIKFIETCANALVKSAEDWVQLMRNRDRTHNTRVMKERDLFKAAFMKQFDQRKSISAQSNLLSGLKQMEDEKVVSFFKAISDFMEKKVGVIYFVNGLLPPIADMVRPRLKELMEDGGPEAVTKAAVEAETALPQKKSSNSSASTTPVWMAAILDTLPEETSQASKEALIAVFNSRGGGGGRGGGRGGRGNRGGGRGGRGGGGNSGNDPQLQKLRSYQSRTKRRHCSRCKQWGKHSAHECRHTNAEINAMAAQDPSVQPPDGTPIVDTCFDGKNEMPAWPPGNV